MLVNKENTFLAAVYFGKRSTGVAFLDASTGEFYAAEGKNSYIDKLLSNLAPKEVIYPKGYEEEFSESFGTKYYTYRVDDWMFSENGAREKLLNQFQVTSLKGYGIDNMPSAIIAAGAEHRHTKHIASISRIDEDKFVWIDKFSIRNLELFASNSGQEGCSLAEVLDQTATPMGGRMLRRWISLPVKDLAEINARLDLVSLFVSQTELRDFLYESLALIGDLERVISRVSVGRVSPREVVQLKNALYAIEKLQQAMKASGDPALTELGDQLDLCLAVRDKIEREIYPDPSNQIQKGGVIASGVNIELDDLRNLSTNAKNILTNIQQRESEATGIPSLKIGFNNVFGYYIEVRNTHKDKVPADWIRKQTLTGAERYITAELKEYEEKILGAESRILAIEQEMYAQLLAELTRYVSPIQKPSGQPSLLSSGSKRIAGDRYQGGTSPRDRDPIEGWRRVYSE